MIRIGICDNNKEHFKKLTDFLNKISEEEGYQLSIKEYKSGDALLFAWEDAYAREELLCLDTELANPDGIEIAKKIREMGAEQEIIFFSADKDRAIEAFDVDAFHYIIKFTTPESRVQDIFTKAFAKIESLTSEVLTVSCAGDSRNIPIDQIKYFQVDLRIITVYYGDSEQFEFYSTIGKIENALNSRGFIRIHRGILVNKYQIKRAVTGEITLLDGTVLPVGRNYQKQVKEELEGEQKWTRGKS
ncbi:LytR/AlgR family response regulator transcription factor [Ohessyouella blattaphilus]|uniref:Stage 0 sporulation protein A homolog n=1 Tax=Ohessyouella blattaphilus TaxID=2949333 RepID=A0ABT1EFU8_9FIRM|nr:LytTR family DNA-binding domain-containing protein [Ohessyouella blattaphilus]MCP1109369.1 LytTR family DNA-binding domain-containing protein [Ohessyouella blattaphilus]MCR8562763.1 LytTR family DNA-binding domain-containing protein [Ohessyouella blattaphilus]MDL2249326.1 LytTR family DNA-binding domain-containing protein [Lachnospiraceae bacterium OttesenSCG-928-J05]